MKMGEKLTIRQRRFAVHMAALGNESEAARRAGYSPARAHVTGAELVRNRKVSEEITRCREEIEKRLGISPLWCAVRYKGLAQAAEARGEFAQARGCLDSLAKLMDWYPKEKKNQSSGYSFEVLLKQIEEEKRVKDITPGRE